MIKTSLKTMLAVSLLMGGGALMAEQKKAPEAAEAPKLKPLTPEAEKAAYRLFDVLKMKEGISNALDQSLKAQVKRQPAMAPYEDIYKNFFHKYTKWEDMKKDLAKLYAQAFSVKEMQELTKFYSSEVGKKSLTLMPRLTQLSMLMAQQRIAKHADELKKAVAEKAKELDAAAKKEKKKGGIYYTPRFIVEYIVNNTLDPHISDIIKEISGKESFKGENIEELERFYEKLTNVKILDPACGTGHFLVYAMERLTEYYWKVWENVTDERPEQKQCESKDRWNRRGGSKRYNYT